MLINKKKLSLARILQVQSVFDIAERRGLSKQDFIKNHIEPKLVLKSMQDYGDNKLQAIVRVRTFTNEILKQL